MRISDAARALSLSPSTVSRALSGNGRISEKTRQRVIEWSRQNAWIPSSMSRTLQYGKSGNIVVVLPKEPNDELSPFFHYYVLGVCETAAAYDCEVIVINMASNDPSCLQTLVRKNKVDGVILTDRTEENIFSILDAEGIPYVVEGNTSHEGAVVIDCDTKSACCEMTSILLENGLRRIAYIGGSPTYKINQARQQGFINAFKTKGLQYDTRFVFTSVESMMQIEQAVLTILQSSVQGIITGDDVICSRLMAVLHRLGVQVPEEMQVASLCHSFLMDIQSPQISCLKSDAKAQSSEAAKLLLDMLQGRQVPSKNIVEHEIAIRGSTRKTLSSP